MHAAHRHADKTGSHDRGEVATRHAPLLNQRGDRKADQLAVEPVQDNGERGKDGGKDLRCRPGPIIDDGADVGRS